MKHMQVLFLSAALLELPLDLLCFYFTGLSLSMIYNVFHRRTNFFMMCLVSHPRRRTYQGASIVCLVVKRLDRS